MKKCLSLLLILVMLVTSYGGALADTLKLPTNLTTIGEEAFFGASSLDVVDIPWGTEIIGSKAFANSSVTKVYIPATVYSIADDAFQGTNITICASAYSYAKEYADSHGIAWEFVRDDIRQEDIEINDLKMDHLELISTEGISVFAFIT